MLKEQTAPSITVDNFRNHRDDTGEGGSIQNWNRDEDGWMSAVGYLPT